jgi:hypothetical protein
LYTSVAQSSNHSVFPLRPNSRSSLDPRIEIPKFRAQSPVRFPTRTLQ